MNREQKLSKTELREYPEGYSPAKVTSTESAVMYCSLLAENHTAGIEVNDLVVWTSTNKTARVQAINRKTSRALIRARNRQTKRWEYYTAALDNLKHPGIFWGTA